MSALAEGAGRADRRSPDGRAHPRAELRARGEGNVERVLREFLIPEDDAFGRPNGRRRTLYRVRLAAHDLWPQYRGPRRTKCKSRSTSTGSSPSKKRRSHE
jgi:hypothetical protein